MKAHYYLSMAQVPLGLLDDALKNALRAHELCVELQDRSISNTTAQVLVCKKAQWIEMERRRKREGQQLENELLEMVDRERERTLKDETDQSTRAEIMDEYNEKLKALQDVFERARMADQKSRKVPPDWAIDDISFGFMVDPVLVSLLTLSYFTLLAVNGCGSSDKDRKVVRARLDPGASAPISDRSVNTGATHDRRTATKFGAQAGLRRVLDRESLGGGLVI